MRFPSVSSSLALILVFALCGCSGPALMGADAAIILATAPKSLPPADTQSQMPEHEVWCYRSIADIQCYATPQNVSPERLVNVEPQNRFPLSPQAYRDTVAGKHLSSAAVPSDTETAPPISLDSAAALPVEKSQPEDITPAHKAH